MESSFKNNRKLANKQPVTVTDGQAGPTVSGSLKPSELRMVKCYRCYSNMVDAVCHHCGRFICSDCLRVSAGWFFTDNMFAYLKPSGGSRLTRGAHCWDCFHQDLRVGRVIGLLLLLSIALILMIGPRIGWLESWATIIGIATVGITGLLIDRLRRRRVAYPIGLPLFSKFKVELQERVKADFNVDSRPYLSPEPIAEGAILVSMEVNPGDGERQERMFSPPFPLKFHAGFIALETLKNVEFVRSVGLREYGDNLLLLAFNSGQETFENRCRQSQNFYLAEPYRIKPDALQIGPPHDKQFPLVIKPRRADGGYRLEMIFEAVADLRLKFAKNKITKKKEDEKGLDGKPILNSLLLHVPVGCEVELTNGHFDQHNRVIRWYKQAMDIKPAFSVWVRFRDVIPNEVEFNGEYSITINNWTISQLHVAPDLRVEQSKGSAKNKYLVRLANGLRIRVKEDKNLEWLLPTVELSTKIEGKLSFNTSYLLSQQVKIASDLVEEKNGKTRIVNEDKLPVAPTYHVVNAIIESLTEREFFIKQVTEIPGYTTETEVGSDRARYWKIWGKYYFRNAFQPIDLHLVISGSGSQNNRPNCEGSLTLEVSFRSYIEMGDMETPEQLKEKYKEVKSLVKIAAYRGRQIDYQGRRILAWQHEEQLESYFKGTNRLDDRERIAVILTGGTKIPQGYVFVGNCRGNQVLNLPAHLEMVSRPGGLPMIEIPGQEWIDKWELLRGVAIRQ